jgi:hypothetical protein
LKALTGRHSAHQLHSSLQKRKAPMRTIGASQVLVLGQLRDALQPESRLRQSDDNIFAINKATM